MHRGGIYLDCGAYIGGTIKTFIEFTDGNYDKIFAFEPDPENFKKLANLIEQKNYRNVFLYNCGVWDKETVIHFKNQGDMGSAVSEDGDINVPVNTIDNVVMNNPVNLIKMDIEGSELHALNGE